MKINPNQYIKTIEDSIKFMVFNRCGLNTGEIEGSIAFERIFDFNERDLTLVLGETITSITETILREIEVEVYSINRELRRRYNEKENSTRGKERNYLGVRGNRWNTISHNGHIQRSRDGQTTREVWESSQDLSKGKPPHEIQNPNDRWGINAPNAQGRQGRQGEIRDIRETITQEESNKGSRGLLPNLQAQADDKGHGRGGSSQRNSLQGEIEFDIGHGSLGNGISV